ncbi:carboxylesterase family protein [Rhodococcus fascians]|nr:carboxylesterase family protein [Rhodococcus fascians]
MTATGNTIVRTAAGEVIGRSDEDHYAFLGIPFAEPPVGDRRFAPPVAKTPWDGRFDATSVGAICPQPYDDLDRLLEVPKMNASEGECLTVNVWTPSERTDEPRPVLVWVHGGSFITGSNAWDIYSGSKLAASGAVVVSINYRLHGLGFLNLTGLFEGAENSVNLAARDAIMGLEWVRDNVAAFGGDPGRVTIFGESAGAAMVSALAAAPATRDLIHRVIPQSGMAHQLVPQEVGRQIAENFLRVVGVEPGDWQGLRDLPVERIVEVSMQSDELLKGVSDDRWLPWNLHRDPLTLPESASEAFASGNMRHLDMLIGTTADENKLAWIVREPDADEDYPVNDLDDAVVARMQSVYRDAGRGRAAWELNEAIVNDQSYFVPANRAVDEHVRQGSRAFVYLFTWRTEAFGGRLGSCHALEVPFVLDLLDHPVFLGPNPPRALADAMHGAWLAFAATGDPNGGSLPTWPEWDSETRPTMKFDVECEVLSSPRAAELRQWDDVPDDVLGVK